MVNFYLFPSVYQTNFPNQYMTSTRSVDLNLFSIYQSLYTAADYSCYYVSKTVQELRNTHTFPLIFSIAEYATIKNIKSDCI